MTDEVLTNDELNYVEKKNWFSVYYWVQMVNVSKGDEGCVCGRRKKEKRERERERKRTGNDMFLRNLFLLDILSLYLNLY